MRPKAIRLTIVLLGALIVLISPGRQLLSAQEPKVWTPCGCFCGFEPPYPPVPPVAFRIINDQPCTGILSADACRQGLESLSRDQLATVCQKVKATKGFTSFKDSCPVFARYCEPEEKRQPPEKKCENPTPWFDPSGCKDVQATQIAIDRRTGTAAVSMCGYVVLRHKSNNFLAKRDPLFGPSYEAAFRTAFPKTVCCNRFREAVKTGKPCDPRQDIDCDGRLNQTDANEPGDDGLPQVELFTQQQNGPIDPFPGGFNSFDPDFMPESTARNSKGVGECPCKWELIKGELKCNGAVGQDGRRQHVYVATWRCAATKAEVFTTKYAPATARCP